MSITLPPQGLDRVVVVVVVVLVLDWDRCFFAAMWFWDWDSTYELHSYYVYNAYHHKD
jgi:hypothetical protein